MNFDLFLRASLLIFGLSILLNFLILKFFPKWGIMDRPERYGHTRNPIPYPGGVSIVISFVLGVLFFFPLTSELVGFLAGGVLLAIVSFLDDRIGIHPLLRLGMQLLLAGILVWSGIKIVYISNPFGPTAFELSPLLSTLITTAWVIGLINTTNWLDGVPGVAAGTSTVAGISLGALSLTPLVDQPDLALMCFLFAAANLGFFFFNIAPPKMLNGDTGAMFSGYVIAVLSIISGGKMATVFLVLALPLFDAATVIFHRLREKRSPLHGKDEKHLHDQLLKKGLSDRQVMLLFLSISVLFGFSAFYLKTLGKISLLVLIGVFVFSISWQHHKRKF